MIKRFLIRFVTKRLLKAVIEEDLLRIDPKNGKMMVGDRYLSPELQSSIRDEAQLLQKNQTLKLLMKDMRHVSKQTMFDKSTSFDDVLFGKAQLYVVDLLEKKINNLAK